MCTARSTTSLTRMTSIDLFVSFLPAALHFPIPFLFLFHSLRSIPSQDLLSYHHLLFSLHLAVRLLLPTITTTCRLTIRQDYMIVWMVSARCTLFATSSVHIDDGFESQDFRSEDLFSSSSWQTPTSEANVGYAFVNFTHPWRGTSPTLSRAALSAA